MILLNSSNDTNENLFFWVQALRAEMVEFIVAPYEADAQLAWLSKLDPCQGGVSVVISEDSDLLVYGCPVVTFLMFLLLVSSQFVVVHSIIV